jgi:hypothetical protein
MSDEYEFEPSAAMLMVQRVAAQRMAGRADQAKLGDLSKAFHKREAELGRKARKLLREHGFERDCEIDFEMEILAAKAQDAVDELGSYIAQQSPKVADFLYKHGDSSLRDWQDENSTPIRPGRRNYFRLD